MLSNLLLRYFKSQSVFISKYKVDASRVYTSYTLFGVCLVVAGGCVGRARALVDR